MNVEDLLKEINVLKEENTELKNHLKKYTAPTRSKTYYENHKDEIIQRNKEYKEKTNYEYVVSPEKKKEYARTAYLNKKEKLKREKEQAGENI